MQDAPSKEWQDEISGHGAKISRLERAIDERDETIRLLNEALSAALDELERVAPRRAA